MVNQQLPPKVPLRPTTGNEDSQRSQNQSQSQASNVALPFGDDWFEDGMSPSQKQSYSQPVESGSQGLRDDALMDRFKNLQVRGSASQPNPDTGIASADSSVVEIPRPPVKDQIKETVHRHNPFHQGQKGQHSYGHPAQMMSALKQRAAGVFVQQKHRPEHHRDNMYRLAAPTNAPRPEIRPPEPRMYGSMDAYEQPPTGGGFGEPEFFTDPTKAAADLKALLEGGMEEEDEEKTEEEGPDGSVEGLNVKLLPHQVEGVEWMKGRELGPVKRGKVPRGGILADDMGLGKTLQTITLILENQRPEKGEKGWKKTYEGVEKTTLVVAPLALIRQWEAEIKEKVARSHKLKVCVHHGPNRTKRFKDLALYDVVITTYQTLVSEHGSSNMAEGGLKTGCFGLQWWRVVLDEAHSIKNKSTKATKACCALRAVFRWCLTGTPLQNKLEELQSLIHFLRIQPYDNLKEFKDHIEKPMNNGKGHIAIRRLHSILRCFMKRRTKDILKKEGALNPGGKPSKPGEGSTTGFRVTERKIVAIQADFSPAEKRFYERLESRTDQSIEKMLKGKVSYANALVLLLRLRQACNHPKLVEGKLEKDKDALSTDVPPQKSSQTSVDDLADMFAGTTIATKSCNICGRELQGHDFFNGRDQCQECFEDLAYFNSHETPKAKKSKKMKVKSVRKEKRVVAEKTETTETKNKRRGRKVIVDSDDEDDEAEDGSWLVPEDQRGKLKLGKAGGQEDEDAEGGGDWIGDEDSKHESEDESRSQLDSFVVQDEEVKGELKPEDYGSDDSFPSVQALCSQPRDEAPVVELSESGSEEDSQSDSQSDSDGIDASDYDSDSDNSIPIYNADRKSKKSSAPSILASAKIRRLVKILHNEVQEHKFIVFSQFTSMLDLIEPFFRKEGFKFTRYDGSMKNDEREESLSRLRNDAGCRILLCSLKCGSLGLNLTAATRVVILEPFWNPFIEEQAIDRVHRLTQKTDVIVYKLTIAATVEERILQLQERKRQLADQAIEGSMKKDAFKLGVKEMLELFRHDGSKDYANQYENGGGKSAAVDERDGATMRWLVPKKKVESGLYGRRW